MSDKNGIEISRRKALAGIGGIGVASAGAGIGTSAYFSDTESFDGNTLTAGELDLKVDWQQSYYGASETIVPINAYPDHDGDGLQSIDDDTEYVLDNADGENEPIEITCNDLESGADLPEDVFASPNRTPDNGGPIDQQDSLVALDDVKPGDWGEVTFSLHLCDNPGYVWLTADNFSQSGGALTEPEQVSMNETDPSSVVEGDDTGDLADNTYVELWYDDDCDNIRDTGGEQNEGEELDVVIVMDRSGSMSGSLDEAQQGANALISALSPDDQVGLVSFSTGGSDGSGGSNDSTLDAGLTTDHGSVQTAVNGLTSGGRTNMEAAVERAHEELTVADTFAEYGESGAARSGARKIMVVLGDGSPNEGTDVTDSDNNSPVQEANNAKNDDNIQIFTIAYGTGSPGGILGDMASDPADYPNIDQFAFDADVSDVVSTFQEIGGVIGGSETLILGEGDGVHNSPVPLSEAMAIMERNDGMIPLDGTGDMGYGEGATSEERDCFPANSQKCIGMKWWVPTDVGNEIQGDSVSFDLGFYTEQCRHNDGGGQSASS
ncbi:SipW-cognate class signal peptide [Halorubrum aquaticum]|uniref:SipW-cognate class signal peptide n=1 Tax=Halorubrum aquaticum TaxID=387340 RepID=A0A1I2Z1U1_9EURY|nr:vWA domain-containing protein [Halorubrum aquaticum]SFH31823.1 SipW-cognate class signal peptide [Halorubrum aquaticum]